MGRSVASLNKQILAEFYQMTRFDIQDYYTRFVDFMKSDYTNLVSYYSGDTNVISANSNKKLDQLLKDNDTIFSLYTQIKTRLNNYMWWDLMDQLEEMQLNLKTVSNLSKWLRSPKNNNAFSKKQEVQLVLRQNQTLELLNKDVLTEENWQDSWVDTAIRNDLNEEAYTLEGGNILKTSFSQSGSINIRGVVDNIFGEKILGLDLDKKLTFEDDDLKVLSYKETFKQSVYILSIIKKYDDPYHPTDGIDAQSAIGSNINIINFPSIFRQMSETFATDDTIASFAITDINRKSDAIFAHFTCKSRLSELSEKFSVQLSN